MLVHEVVAGFHKRNLQGGADVHLGAATRDQIAELLGAHPGSTVERHRDARRGHDVSHSLGIEFRRRLVGSVSVADRRREDVDAGCLHEVDNGRQRLDVLGLVADHLLGPLEAFDLAFDVRPVLARFGHDLDALALVLVD